MELKNFFAQDDQGNKLPGATCYLYQRGTESPVPGMLKSNGIGLTNPFLADKNGLVQLAAPNGLYDIRVVSGARDYRLQLQFNDVTETVEAAEAAALRAETAQDAAVIAVGIKDDVAHGLATTSPGENFQALSSGSDKFVTLYKNKGGGVAQPLDSYPNAKAVTDLSDDYQATIAKGDSNRSLYWGGILSKSGMIGVAFRKTDGHPIFANGRDLLGDVAALRSRVKTVSAPRSGVLLGIATPSGRLLAHFDAYSGAWITGGRNALSEIDQTNLRIDALDSAANDPIADFPIADWACWGDSLTAEGSSGNWAKKLATTLGVNIYNGGWGGQAFRQIAARQGATPSLMTVVGGTIPASGAVAVTTNAYYPASNGGSVSGTLSGVPGTYTRAADGLSATFTRTASGEPVISPANAVFAPLYGTAMRDRHVVLWSGANSVYYEADQYDIIASIRPMIDYLTPRVKRVIVMEIPPSAARTLPAAPGSDREKLEKYNAMLKAAFPEYFLDIASWLRTQAAATAAGIAFTAQDLTDIANGVTPTSFTTDGLHFSDAGGNAIAYRVRQEAITRGWIA